MRPIWENGWYIDALPDGAYVVLIRDSHLETSRGRVELPAGQNVLQISLAPDGIRFAGTGHHDDLAWEWTGTSWVSHGKAHGIRACIYDADGQLHIARGPQPPTGSQGWRYVSDTGELVFSDRTYADPARRVWEYIDRAGITVGQGGDGPHGQDPLIVLHGGKRYRVQGGQCRFIKFPQPQGDHLTISWVQEDRREAHILRLTVADLWQFPLDDAPAPPPPSPPPEPPMPESLIEIVTAVWEDYGGQNRGAMLNAIAYHGNGDNVTGPWGLSRKTGGNHVEQPKTGEKVAGDIVQYGHTRPDGTATMFDVFTDSGPVWIEAEQHLDTNRIWIPAVVPDGVPDPPEPPAPPDDPLVERVLLLEAAVAVLAGDLRVAKADLIALQAKVETHGHPAPELPKLRIVADSSAPEISTSRTWSHAHSLRLKIVKE
jgi:hypothetical protein